MMIYRRAKMLILFFVPVIVGIAFTVAVIAVLDAVVHEPLVAST